MRIKDYFTELSIADVLQEPEYNEQVPSGTVAALLEDINAEIDAQDRLSETLPQ